MKRSSRAHIKVPVNLDQRSTAIEIEPPRKEVEIPGIFKATLKGNLEKVKELINKDTILVNAEYKAGTPLSVAAANGHSKIVLFLLNHNANANKVYPCAGNSTVLHAAAEKGQVEIVELLVQYAEIQAENDNGDTPLHLAAQNGHSEVVKLLVAQAKTQAKNHHGQTPLYLAAYNEHLEVVKILLHHKVDANLENTNGMTPLYIAVNKGYLEIAKALLEHGANVQTAYAHGKTLLHLASQNNHPAVVMLLLSHKAEINAVDIDNITPLYVTALMGHLEILEILLENNAHIQTHKNKTPLHAASENGHLEVVKALLGKKANLHATNQKGETPLHSAALNGHSSVVNILLINGADVNSASNNGRTALYSAAEQGNIEVINILLKEEGVKVNALTTAQTTPLHIASKNGHRAVVEVLLKNGAKVNATDKNGITPLHAAVHAGKLDTVKELLKNGATITARIINLAKPHPEIAKLLQSHQELCTAITNQDASEVKKLLQAGAVLSNQGKESLLTSQLSSILSELEKKDVSTAFSSVKSHFSPKKMYFDKAFLVIDFKDDTEANYFLETISIIFKPVDCRKTESNMSVHLKWPFSVDETFSQIWLYRQRKKQLEKTFNSLRLQLKATSWAITAITPGDDGLDKNLRIFFQGTPVDSFELKDTQVSITAAPEGITVELPMEFLLEQEKKALLDVYIRRITDKIAKIEAKEAPIKEKERIQKEEMVLERLRISAQIKEEKEKEEKRIRRLQAQNKKKEVAFTHPGKENPLLNEKETLEPDRLKPSDDKQALRKREPNFFASPVAPKSPKQFDQRNSRSSSSSSSSSGYPSPSPK